MKSKNHKSTNSKKQKPKAPAEMKESLENLLKEIRELVGNGNYIFRGESKNYGKISSKLYRYIQTIVGQAASQQRKIPFNFNFIKKTLESQSAELSQSIDFAIIEKVLKENILAQLAQKTDYGLKVEEIQKDLILKDVQEYVDFENEIDILAELQHYGGSTNLIDFTHDLAVALFFACDGEHEEDGRLILLDANAKGVIAPKKNQNNRIVFQKSIFVQRNNGHIEEEEVKQFIIPKELKSSILNYVQNHFGIKTETIYGDLMGYIQNPERYGEAYKHFFAGSIHYAGKTLKEEVGSYTKAIQIKPNFAEAYNNRGNAKLRINPPDSEGAIGDYTKAIKLNPNYADAYNNRGAAYNKKDKNDLAIADFTKAIELKPNYADAYNNRGGFYIATGKHDLAIADFNKAIELKPNEAVAYSNRSYAYDNEGEYDLAIADCNKAIELNPYYVEAYNNRGNAYGNKGDYALALADFTKAIELNPDYAEAYNNRGVFYSQKGNNALALADYKKAIELNPNDAMMYNNRGSAYNKKGKHDIAIADYKKAIEINPNFVEAYNNRGLTKKILQDFKGARKDLETAVRLAKQQDNKTLVTLIQEGIAGIPNDSDS